MGSLIPSSVHSSTSHRANTNGSQSILSYSLHRSGLSRCWCPLGSPPGLAPLLWDPAVEGLLCIFACWLLTPRAVAGQNSPPGASAEVVAVAIAVRLVLISVSFPGSLEAGGPLSQPGRGRFVSLLSSVEGWRQPGGVSPHWGTAVSGVTVSPAPQTQAASMLCQVGPPDTVALPVVLSVPLARPRWVCFRSPLSTGLLH